MRICGIDGCRSGWIAVCAEADNLASAKPVYSQSLRELVKEGFSLVDMPIGLSQGPKSRGVETALREALKGKASSVFPTPSRSALAHDDYQEACKINVMALGKKLSKQSHALFPKLREVDQVVREAGQKLMREGHPEASFSCMNGSPVLAGKKSAAGIGQRLALLENAGIPAMSILADTPEGDIAVDDVLDAAALLWSARRFVTNTHNSFPPKADLDSAGLEMSVIA